MMYRVIVTFVVGPDEQGYTTARALPTFYLDPMAQGITDYAHAERIAIAMVKSVYGENCGCAGPIEVFASAMLVPIKELLES